MLEEDRGPQGLADEDAESKEAADVDAESKEVAEAESKADEVEEELVEVSLAANELWTAGPGIVVVGLPWQPAGAGFEVVECEAASRWRPEVTRTGTRPVRLVTLRAGTSVDASWGLHQTWTSQKRTTRS